MYLAGTLVNQFLGQFLNFSGKNHFAETQKECVFQDMWGSILLIGMPNHLGGPFLKTEHLYPKSVFVP